MTFVTRIMNSSFTTWWCGIPRAHNTKTCLLWLVLFNYNGRNDRWHKWFKPQLKKWIYSQIGPVIKTCFGVVVVIKYLIISQHDDSYTTLDKMKHLLVNHYVRNDVQSLNVVFCIKMQVQKLYPHYNKSCPLNQTQKWLLFFTTTFIIT
jgi:hypothetical protein